MEISYELTQRDVFDSMIAHRNRSPAAKWWFRIMFLTAVATGAVGIFLIIKEPTSELTPNALILVVVAVFWAACKFVSPWWSARNQYRKQPSAQGSRTLMLDSAGIHWHWDGGTSDVAWRNITRFLEGKSGFLLYTSPVMFIMIPRRALSEEQVTELRGLLTAHVPKSIPK